MHILNLEDNMIKHNDICKAVARGAFRNLKIDCSRNLEEGISKIEEAIQSGNPYDVIITDMWYPQKAGGDDFASGEVLIQKSQEKGWNIPIILCSSVRYRYPGILGAVHYSEREDWETELLNLVKEI